MDRNKAFSYTAGCYSGEPASCTYACPFRLDLRSFLKKAARGRWDAAYKELQGAVLFPEVVAALCPRPCEGACQRRTVVGDDPVAMGLLERASIHFTKKKEPASYTIPPKAGRVAVVGAGPAGLSCALLLGQKRFSVTVFERNEGWGGSQRAHPAFSAFDEDFHRAFAGVEVEFRFASEVASLEELAGFDAVLLATGRGGADLDLLPGWDPALFTTENPRVFLCGELTGASLMEGMAQAAGAVRSVEAFVQSGSVAFAADQAGWDRSKCTRYVPHPDTESLPRVCPAGEAYTEEEAKGEAARCMQCDCEACMAACELLIQYKKKPPRINSDVFMDSQGRNSVSSACITRQTWSCNLCGRCGRKCHTDVDLRGLFQFSRADRVQSGNYPPALHDFWLREMYFYTGEGSFAASKEEGASCNYVFFPGCALGASNPEHVKRAYAFLREELDAGLLLNCCGVPAFWAGDDAGFNAHLEKLRILWQGLGGPILVTACATCDRMLDQFLPEIKRVSLYEILAERGPKGGISPFLQAAVFDPCAAAAGEGMKAAVRALVRRQGIELSPYDSDGRCCGHGGHMRTANPKLYEKITLDHATQSEDPYVLYCANCRAVFTAQGKDCAHVLDLVFGLERSGVPSLEEKRHNSLAVKGDLMEAYWGKAFVPEAGPWDGMQITLPPRVAQKMEERLITLGDVREAVWRAEQAGVGFRNEKGEILCNLKRENVTYWVLYSNEAVQKEEPHIRVVDAYSHRMKPREK